MVFLPGDHILDRTITVVNVASLTMQGDSFSDKDQLFAMGQLASVSQIR